VSNWIEKVDKEILLEILGDLMSNISEDCYSAEWYEGSEYIIPALCVKASKLGRSRPWAHGEVSLSTASLLISISNRLGGWANISAGNDGYVLFNPFPTPKECEEEIEFWKNKVKNERK
jgi:hypothetical protein